MQSFSTEPTLEYVNNNCRNQKIINVRLIGGIDIRFRNWHAIKVAHAQIEPGQLIVFVSTP